MLGHNFSQHLHERNIGYQESRIWWKQSFVSASPATDSRHKQHNISWVSCHQHEYKLRLFLTTGIDYVGPIALRLGTPRSKTITKGYIAIFVCFMTKAVHIEVVTSLTTKAFLAALRHFIARWGKPKTIYSDNGTNFQRAANELYEIYKMLHSTSQRARVQDFLTTEGCKWRFIPPHGPPPARNFPHYLLRYRPVYIPDPCVPYPLILWATYLFPGQF